MAVRRPRPEPRDIPDLPEEEILSRAFRVKQIGKASDNKLHFIESTHLDRVQPDRGRDVASPHILEEARGFRKIATITTIHRSVMPAYFMPSVKDVLAQIPAELLGQVTAYAIEPDKDNPRGTRPNTDRAVTTLYAGPLPEHIASQPVVLAGKIYRPPTPPPAPQDIPVMRQIRLRPKPPGV